MNLNPYPSPKQSILVPITLSLLCVAGLGLGFLVPGAGVHLSRLKQSSQESTSSASPPVVSIQSQPNAPLSILAVKSDSATVHNPEFDLTVMNASDKPIRAYAIRYDTVSAQLRPGGLELTNKQGLGAVLQPGQSETIDIGGGIYQADDITRIIVSVDFVEFGDGSSWGPDTYQSAERLDGLRAGAHAAAQYLLKVLQTAGPASVFTTLKPTRLIFLHRLVTRTNGSKDFRMAFHSSKNASSITPPIVAPLKLISHCGNRLMLRRGDTMKPFPKIMPLFILVLFMLSW